jgi:hypothetical protein
MHGSEEHFGSLSKLHLGNIALILEILPAVRVYQMLNGEHRTFQSVSCIRRAGLYQRGTCISVI